MSDEAEDAQALLTRACLSIPLDDSAEAEWIHALEVGDGPVRDRALLALAALALDRGDASGAAARFDELVARAEADGDRERIAAMLLERALCGDRVAAENDLARAEGLVAEDHPLRGGVALRRAQRALGSGENDEAAAQADAARAIAVRAGNALLYVGAALALSQAHEAAGRAVQAYDALVRARVSLGDLLGSDGEQLIAPTLASFEARMGSRFAEVWNVWVDERQRARGRAMMAGVAVEQVRGRQIPPISINANPDPATLLPAIQKQIEEARGGGTAAVVAKVKSLLASAQGSAHQAVQMAMQSLTPEEKEALDGKKPDGEQGAAKGGEGGAKPGGTSEGEAAAKPAEKAPEKPAEKPAAEAQPKPVEAKEGAPEKGDEAAAKGADGKDNEGKAKEGKDKEAKEGKDKEGKDKEGKDKENKDKEGKDKDGDEAKAGGEGKGAKAGGAGDGGTPGAEGADRADAAAGGTKEGGGSGGSQRAAAPPEKKDKDQALSKDLLESKDGRKLIEAELSEHESWGELTNNRGAAVGKTVAGSAITGAAIGAGMYVGAKGLALLAQKLPVPGLSNIVGGGLSAWVLFGAGGWKHITHNLGDGVRGVANLAGGKGDKWENIANAFAGVHALVELIGHGANMISGGLFALSGVGVLASIVCPAVIPFIPVGLSLATGAGAVGQVALLVASGLSTVPPAVRAVGLLKSEADPVKLLESRKRLASETRNAAAALTTLSMQARAEGKGLVKNSFDEGAKAAGSVKSPAAIREQLGVPGAAKPAAPAAGAKPAEAAPAAGGGAKPAEAAPAKVTPEQAAQFRRDYFKPRSEATAQARHHEEKVIEATRASKAAKREADEIGRELAPGASSRYTPEELAGLAARHQAAIKKVAEADAAVASHKHDLHHAESHGKDKIARDELLQTEGKGGSVADVGNNAAGLHADHAREHRDEAGGKAHAGGGKGRPNLTQRILAEKDTLKATYNKKGHVNLPPPPEKLDEIDGLDEQIKAKKQEAGEAGAAAQNAGELGREAQRETVELGKATTEINQHKGKQEQDFQQGEQEVSAKGQQAQEKAQTVQTDANAKQDKVAGAVKPLIGPTQKVESFVSGIPDNPFFDAGALEASVREFREGLEDMCGEDSGELANGVQELKEQGQKVGEARSEQQDVNAAHDELGQKVDEQKGAAQEVTTEAQAAQQQGEAAKQGADASVEQLQSQRTQKWSSLLTWAAQHRELRERVAGGQDNH